MCEFHLQCYKTYMLEISRQSLEVKYAPECHKRDLTLCSFHLITPISGLIRVNTAISNFFLLFNNFHQKSCFLITFVLCLISFADDVA